MQDKMAGMALFPILALSGDNHFETKSVMKPEERKNLRDEAPHTIPACMSIIHEF